MRWVLPILLCAVFAVYLALVLLGSFGYLDGGVKAQTAGNPSWVINQAQCSMAVTPSDTTDLSNSTTAPCQGFPAKGVYTAGSNSGTACTMVMALLDGQQNSWQNVQPGATLPYRVRRIYSTNTTCTGIIALY